MADKNYTDVLLEDINGKFDLIVEVVGSIQDNVKHIPQMREDISAVKRDVKTIKVAVTETNKELGHLEKRVARLEKARV